VNISFDELKRLDPKDVGSWPSIVQLAALLTILIAVTVIGYFALLDGQRDLLSQGRAHEAELKQAFLDKKTKAINLEAYKEQLNDIQQAFGALLKQLPSKAEMETLITEINQSGVGRGLQFELFKPATNEQKTTEFAERPIDIKVNGSYHDLAAFASDVAQLSRIVTLGNIQISSAAAKDGGQLSMQVVAKTYRALDQEEAVAMKKAKADAKKKP
jgi:type IV pilus assembly protein PilO